MKALVALQSNESFPELEQVVKHQRVAQLQPASSNATPAVKRTRESKLHASKKNTIAGKQLSCGFFVYCGVGLRTFFRRKKQEPSGSPYPFDIVMNWSSIAKRIYYNTFFHSTDEESLEKNFELKKQLQDNVKQTLFVLKLYMLKHCKTSLFKDLKFYIRNNSLEVSPELPSFSERELTPLTLEYERLISSILSRIRREQAKAFKANSLVSQSSDRELTDEDFLLLIESSSAEMFLVSRVQADQERLKKDFLFFTQQTLAYNLAQPPR